MISNCAQIAQGISSIAGFSWTLGRKGLGLVLVFGVLLLLGCREAGPETSPMSVSGPQGASRQSFDTIAGSLSLGTLKRVRPAVVRINTDVGSGSGVIVQTQGSTGFVITNHHVIAGASLVHVIVEDRFTYEGQMLSSDPVRDLAIVMICCGNFQKALFADSTGVEPTTEVLVIGYPQNIDGAATVTKGIVSAVRFDVGLQAEIIQTDAAVNPGNSGGPTATLDGEVLGITTYKFLDSEGLAFAVSSSVVLQQLPSLWATSPVVPPVPSPVPINIPTPASSPAPDAISDDNALEERVQRLEMELRQSQARTPTPSPDPLQDLLDYVHGTQIPVPTPSPSLDITPPEAPASPPIQEPTLTPHPCSIVKLESVEEMDNVYTRFLAADPSFQSVSQLARQVMREQFSPLAAVYISEAIGNPLKYASFREYLGQADFWTDGGEIKLALDRHRRMSLLPHPQETLYEYNERRADDPCTIARAEIFRQDELAMLVAIAYAESKFSPVISRYVRDAMTQKALAFRDGDVSTPLFLWFFENYPELLEPSTPTNRAYP